MIKENIPEEYQKIDASASLIAKENYGIKKNRNKHILIHPQFPNEIYMIGFGDGEKTENNAKGFYAYWVWFHKEPYGAQINCELKDKFDSIDYFQSCVQNAEATITEVLKQEEK